jgi:hypothetical protein
VLSYFEASFVNPTPGNLSGSIEFYPRPPESIQEILFSECSNCFSKFEEKGANYRSQFVARLRQSLESGLMNSWHAKTFGTFVFWIESTLTYPSSYNVTDKSTSVYTNQMPAEACVIFSTVRSMQSNTFDIGVKNKIEQQLFKISPFNEVIKGTKSHKHGA